MEPVRFSSVDDLNLTIPTSTSCPQISTYPQSPCSHWDDSEDE